MKIMEKKVHAFIVLKEEAYYDELLQHCEKHLATYKIPEAFHIIQSLPKNSTGKILKRHLKERIERKVTE